MAEAVKNGEVIYGMPAEEYFAIPALSNSAMKDLAVSPLRFWHLHINPERPEREETDAMKIGSALHCAVLEGDECFDRRYAEALNPAQWVMKLDTLPEIRQWITDKGFKAVGTVKGPMIEQALSIMDQIGEHIPIVAHEERKFYAANEGKIVLQPDQWRQVAGMSRALLGEPKVQEILASGKPEVVILATDPETGVPLKCKLDWFNPDTTLDLKSFAQKRGKSIDQSVCDAIWYEGYHKQGFLYDHIRKLATGEKSRFVEAFVESDEPHETRIKRMGDTGNVYWQIARTEVKALIRLYADCSKEYGDRPWRTQQGIALLEDEDMKQVGYS